MTGAINFLASASARRRSTALGTPFPLGAYNANTDAFNSANQAVWDRNYDSFVAVMGTVPLFITMGIDYSVPFSGWIGSASEQAQSNARSPKAAPQIPAIGLGLFSVAAGQPTQLAQLQSWPTGANDALLAGVVQAYSSQGFLNQYWRVGWEMNLGGTPTDARANSAAWVTAFQYIATKLRAAGVANGAQIHIIWNPGAENNSTLADITPFWPGPSYVDIIGWDIYAGYTGTGNTPQIINYALTQGKPFAVCETGCGNPIGTDFLDNNIWPGTLSAVLLDARSRGLQIVYVLIWNWDKAQFSNVSDNKPNERAAWRKYFGLQQQAPQTNLLDNSVNGAVVGTPGTLPTNWGYFQLNGLSTQIVGTGTLNGVSYIDIRFFGTTTAAGNTNLYFSPNVAISPSVAYTYKLDVAFVAGSQAGITSTQMNLDTKTSAGAYDATPITSTISITGTVTEFSAGATSSAAAAFAQVYMVLNYITGATINVTYRIVGRYLTAG